ncbi:MAG: 30S ribosome-binding factor RbfA [Deltaproteobacteria bacterium]|nr:30S ribosome-binding factor RbfA [Deltaproteobacteria bacterium]MBW1929462.1 30S ribosome-binding factor RbfA [Deltaproteobacteria bacterium]MBW2023879.1 30S ribosome-binding factor RbfA [Deltaproteobacteria bacterium]MBW2124168.1 30S ribosome-binding factor RbfA [Deltaproteobacteria bacterium]RLB19415.1 MAG: 30S ribosome-binding factor RbfA [Deltaproteobacteria bacterium]
MLAGKRTRRVGEQILKEIAVLLLESVKDPRVKSVTMTGIRLSKDLKHARVYYSVLGGRGEVGRAQAGLDSAKGYIKRKIGQRLALRYVPELLFIHDESLEVGTNLEKLLETLKRDESWNNADEDR